MQSQIMGAMKALCCGPGKDKMPTVWLDEIAGGDDGGPLVDAASIGKMKSFMDHFASHGVEPTDAEAEALLRAIHDSDEATFVDTVSTIGCSLPRLRRPPSHLLPCEQCCPMGGDAPSTADEVPPPPQVLAVTEQAGCPPARPPASPPA